MDKSDPISLSDFDYELPAGLIAQRPASPRDASRLLMVPRDGGAMEHRVFKELPQLLRAGDVLVTNQTKVLPARLRATLATGGKVEVLLCRPHDGDVEHARVWRCMARPARKLRPQTQLMAAGQSLWVEEREEDMVLIASDRPLVEVARAAGETPLPPYIERAEGPSREDASDYQSVFAKEEGSAAAPTASLHFTPQVLQDLEERGVVQTSVTLHVGPGTFLPVRPEHAEDVRQHRMHEEWYQISEATAGEISRAKSEGRRVIAVGTTVVRTLEGWAATGQLSGLTDIFIVPGYKFRVVDGLVTNFHFPRSTLLMLVSALATRERIMDAYQEAIAKAYRFFSYGDAMLIA